MKKFFAIILAALCMASLIACNGNQEPNGGSSSETESSTATESASGTESATESETVTAPERPAFSASSIEKKGNRYVIVLPESKAVIPVRNSLEKYLSRVSDDLVKAAEAKIAAAAGEIDDDLNWELVVDGDDLCITVEVIKFVEGADYMEEGGCGIDHEHIVFTEVITVGQ